MPHSTQDKRDYFDDNVYETASDSDNDHSRRDQQIREAPYLPRVQVWAREGGPYTLRVGKQWFHCDDLVINGTEYQKKTNKASVSQNAATTNASVYPPQRSKRPASSRSQSYQRTRPNKQAGPVVSSPTPSQNQLASHDHYQPQSLPTPQEQSERHRLERRRQKELDEPKEARRERRDSGAAMSDSPVSSGALVTYSRPPPTQTLNQLQQQQSRPVRPSPLRRGSSRNNSYQIPIRRGKKNVRFELPG